MNRFLKYGLLTLAVVVIVVAGSATFIVLTFDPNDYKPKIVQLVKDKTQRKLRLDGDIRMAFYPNIGIDLGKASLSEPGSDKGFASFDAAHISLALLPLFSKQVVVDEVRLSGLDLSLVRFRDGTSNFDDLLHKEQGQQRNGPADSSGGVPVKLDIAAVRLDRAALNYRDESSGAQYALKDITLDIGRISGGAPIPLGFSATLQATQPKLDMRARLQTRLSLDLDKSAYRMTGLDVTLTGTMAASDLAAHVSIPELEGDAQSFKSGLVTLELDSKRPQQDIKVKLVSPVNIDFKSQRYDFPSLAVTVDASGEIFSGQPASSLMRGNAQLDAARQTVQVNLAGRLLQSQVKSALMVDHFSAPAIQFDLDVDQFDADPYLSKKADSGAAGTASPASEKPLDLSELRKLDLQGKLHIGLLKVAGIKISQLRLVIKASKGVLSLDPHASNLYDGKLNGSIRVNAVPAKPAIQVKEDLQGIDIAPLLKDAAGFDALEGKGNINLALDAQGDSVSAMKRGLNGTIALNLADGAIKGINIARTIRNFDKSSGTQTQAANRAERTDFSELKASFRVNDGVAHNDDLMLKSPLLRLSGNGDIDIGHGSIDYLARATLSRTLAGHGGKDKVAGYTIPVRLRGPYAELKYSLDFGALVGDAAKQKVEAKKQEVKTRLQNQLQQGLKGLFK